MVDDVKSQIIELIGCQESEIILASAKSGVGIDSIFNAIINKIPPPNDRDQNSTRALIFDSTYDNYRGAIPYVRIYDGVQASDIKHIAVIFFFEILKFFNSQFIDL